MVPAGLGLELVILLLQGLLAGAPDVALAVLAVLGTKIATSISMSTTMQRFNIVGQYDLGGSGVEFVGFLLAASSARAFEPVPGGPGPELIGFLLAAGVAGAPEPSPAGSSRRIHLAFERDCSGRPSSMHMWSPHDIGRESWVWEEQEAL